MLRRHCTRVGDLTKLVAAQSEKLTQQDRKLDEILHALKRKSSVTSM